MKFKTLSLSNIYLFLSFFVLIFILRVKILSSKLTIRMPLLMWRRSKINVTPSICVFGARSMVKEIHLDEGQSPPSVPRLDILLLKSVMSVTRISISKQQVTRLVVFSRFRDSIPRDSIPREHQQHEVLTVSEK